jgi:hypothetical protein
MTQAVDISNFVNEQVIISPMAAAYQLFGIPLILTDEDVIDTGERFRDYANIDGVGADFGTNSAAYGAATVFFSQQPQPARAFIGRWASGATAGLLKGGILTPQQKVLTAFTAVTTGAFTISVDGSPHTLTGIDLHSVTNLNGVASAIQTVGTAYLTCTWDAAQSRFVIKSKTTGASSTVSFGSAPGSGTDITPLLKLKAADGAVAVDGVVAESALDGLTACADASSVWYGAMFAKTSVDLDIDDHVACAAYILASSRSRMYGVSICGANTGGTEVLDPLETADLASTLSSLNNRRIVMFYSASVQSSVATMYGRAFTVNFNAANSTITLAYKTAPGIPGEQLTQTQFDTIKAKGCNVNVLTSLGDSFIWPGQMANGFWMDEVHGVDWFANRCQTDVYNGMRQTVKVPQTDEGSNIIAGWLEGAGQAAVFNGLLAPNGQWNTTGFGSLEQGMTLPKGFYIFFPSINTQAQADREKRLSVVFQLAAKLAGAVHVPNVLISVNR